MFLCLYLESLSIKHDTKYCYWSAIHTKHVPTELTTCVET